MQGTKQIAKHLRDVHFGGNWTSVNLQTTLADVDWKEAITKIDGLNTIAALVFHINYYISAVLKVLHGEELNAHDKYSFDLPEINSEQDWKNFLEKTWKEAKEFADEIEKLDDKKLTETFSQEKYGTYYRNLHGIIEHTHYHLGQVVILKKIIKSSNKPN